VSQSVFPLRAEVLTLRVSLPAKPVVFVFPDGTTGDDRDVLMCPRAFSPSEQRF